MDNGRVLLIAALVPPREILDDLWSVLDAGATDTDVEVPPTGRRGSLLRRRRATPREAQPAPVLDIAPVAHVSLTIAKLGNLALLDANRLAEALGRGAAEWSSPRLRLAGYSTPEDQEDASIWVDLEGDLDALRAVARGVHDVAKGLRLFVDRRLFQPRVRLGTVSPSATEPELEALLSKLERFETNAWWQRRLTLLTPVDLGVDQPSFKSFADLPLGPHVVH